MLEYEEIRRAREDVVLLNDEFGFVSSRTLWVKL